LSGEAGFVLRRNPDSTVGIDVAYVSAELAVATPERARFVEGVPILAVEILSPSDKQEEILEKVGLYLEVGIALVWIVEPYFQTVTVHRPNSKPEMFNTDDELVGDPHLKGFRVRVADFFRQ
jgi:Uma2 family endonuclease